MLSSLLFASLFLSPLCRARLFYALSRFHSFFCLRPPLLSMITHHGDNSFSTLFHCNKCAERISRAAIASLLRPTQSLLLPHTATRDRRSSSAPPLQIES